MPVRWMTRQAPGQHQNCAFQRIELEEEKLFEDALFLPLTLLTIFDQTKKYDHISLWEINLINDGPVTILVESKKQDVK